MMQTLTLRTSQREELMDITSLIEELVRNSGVTSGMAICFVPHTTAGITINEAADPDVRRDIIYKLGKEIPAQDGYNHAEGNSDAHIKASLMGSSLQILVENGHLVMGQWQGIYFCEFDGQRTRQLIVKVAQLA
jgi:secondary thiamine-phosphate synthase enzyme